MRSTGTEICSILSILKVENLMAVPSLEKTKVKGKQEEDRNNRIIKRLKKKKKLFYYLVGSHLKMNAGVL
jgi:hypothetical protein